jgi:FkbM family methyltransferase
MRKQARIILEKIGKKIIAVAQSIALEPQERRVIPWFKAQGDKTYRLNYDLSENSLVLDIGGYEGQWASDIFSRYCCIIHIFEPIEEYANQLESRFIKNPKIVVHKFGLSSQSLKTKISVNLDSSSVFRGDGESQEIQLIKAVDFIRDYKIEKIDLVKINIEGGEYDLLEHLIKSEFIQHINNIQVQFHDFVPNAVTRMANIQNALSQTHYLTYQYPFVWENWRRNDSSNPP